MFITSNLRNIKHLMNTVFLFHITIVIFFTTFWKQKRKIQKKISRARRSQHSEHKQSSWKFSSRRNLYECIFSMISTLFPPNTGNTEEKKIFCWSIFCYYNFYICSKDSGNLSLSYKLICLDKNKMKSNKCKLTSFQQGESSE